MAEEAVTIIKTSGSKQTPVGLIGEMSAEFVTRAMDFGDDKQEKIIEGVVFELEYDISTLALQNLQFYIGTADRLKDDPTWHGPYTIPSQDAPVWLPKSIPAGRYIYLKFQDTQIVGIWELSAVEILGYPDGGRM